MFHKNGNFFVLLVILLLTKVKLQNKKVYGSSNTEFKFLNGYLSMCVLVGNSTSKRVACENRPSSIMTVKPCAQGINVRSQKPSLLINVLVYVMV